MLRALPSTQPRWSRDADVVVVGSGAAGMAAALVAATPTAAARGWRVLLLSKNELGGGSTPFAQGGMAAVLDPDDSVALHAEDTLTAGAGLCNPAAVSALVSEAPEVISWLSSLGARFGNGHLEGGHSRRRIVHAGGDAVGAEVHRVLARALLASPVSLLTHAVALDLVDGGLLVGLARPGEPSLVLGMVRARAVVLATGGFGQAYATTTNPAAVTGDGLALAARAGAALRDVEFVQFHPTVLWDAEGRGQCPLITEALRGAGAVLVDDSGRPAVPDSLAPRDVVSAAMLGRMSASGAPHLWLDATSVQRLDDRFPTVSAACRERGIDPATVPVPPAPRVPPPPPPPPPRPGDRGDPCRARRALRVRRGACRHDRPDFAAGCLRRGRGRPHWRARREPARLELPHRGDDHGPPARRPARPRAAARCHTRAVRGGRRDGGRPVGAARARGGDVTARRRAARRDRPA
jgi:aspartate oxidase